MQFYRLISDNIEEAKGSCIALLGGGGKTALLHKLADEFAKYYPAVLQTSLTKTAFHPSDNPLILNEIDINKLELIQFDRNPIFLIGEKINNEKLKGISETDLAIVRNQFDITIFECDGARNKPLKAHTDYDPAVPDFTTHVVIIIGADVVSTKVGDGLVHRPELFSNKWSVESDFELNIDFIVDVVSSKKGYLSKVNHNMEIKYFVNKWDNHRKNAEDLARTIYLRTGKPTFYGSVKNNILKKVIK
ncbi:selenium cofactor biosynthesis protein YqeC [Candidatus Neomarinimicrobiota bacterium]